MIILLYMIIKQKEKGKKERKKDNRYIKVHIGTLRYFLSISYKDVFIRVLLFTYFKLYFVYVVCTVHGTQ